MIRDQSRASGIKDMFFDPPPWAIKWIFGSTMLLAVISLLVFAIKEHLSPTLLLILVVQALVAPWLIYWLLVLIFLTGTFGLGAGRAWRSERFFDE
jgi:hypothetical protein